MSKKWTKWYLLIGSTLGTMCCTLGCISIAKFFSTKNPTEKFPIRTLSIQIDQDQLEELFSQLQIFADKHYLKFYPTFHDKQMFFIEMEGKGFEITASARPATLTKVDIGFYEKDPANPPSKETVDELFSELKIFIREIPNATILEEK